MIDKIQRKSVLIGIIGMGYVGLPLAMLFANKGFKVIGFARNKNKIELLNNGISDIESVTNNNLKVQIAKGNFRVKHIESDDLAVVDVIIVCVPTPVNRVKKPDLTAIRDVANRLSQLSLDGKLVINESTVAPGTTREEFGSLGGAYYLACSPERVDPGNKDKTVSTISKVVGGRDTKSLHLATLLYEKILQEKVVVVSSLEAAEMVKMLENSYRAVNIALVNEFARLCEQVNLDVVEIIEAAKSKWSYHAHYPGVGVGGHCIPVDPWYLVEYGEKHNIHMKIIAQSLEENDDMAEWVAQKVIAHYVKGMNVLLYGLSYKKDLRDLRESPAERLGVILQKNNIEFKVFDPYVQRDEIKAHGFIPGVLKKVGIFIVGTDHSQLKSDYKKCVDENTVIIDGKNFFLKKAGKHVFGVGRRFV